jgi:hypothetical protein
VRGIIVDNDVPDAVARIRNVKVYPWSEQEDPKPNKVISISGALIDTTPPGGMEYWARLATVIDNNPVQEHDRFYMAMLKPLGSRKVSRSSLTPGSRPSSRTPPCSAMRWHAT